MTKSLLTTLGAVLAILSACLPSHAENITARTIAGSGRAGFDDGAARSASFIMPMGMAYDAAGNLYITDGAAQRIRVMSPNGVIRTLAGGGSPIHGGLWVPGGYADGPGVQARFNRPSGIAVGPDGNIYISDSYNNCIRKMTPDGTVSTFAGNPATPGLLNGPRLTAHFTRPMGLKFAKDGDLYVADADFLRKIDTAGNVSYILVGNQPTDLAIADGTSGPTIFVTSYEGLIVRTPDGKLERWATVEARRAGDHIIQGGKQLGHPFGIVAYNDHQIAYTDVRSDTVRFLDTRYGLERILAGVPNEDASADTGGYVDGSGTAARFNAPMGLALRNDGSILLADAGNRRIRLLSAPDRRGPLMLSADLLGAHEFGPRDYKVALAGNSFVWYNTDWQGSIEGRVERAVSADPRFPSRSLNLHVVPVWGTGRLDATDQYLKSTLSLGLFDAMLLNINAIDIAGSFGLKVSELSRNPGAWQDQLTAKLKSFKADAASARVPVAVVIEPLPNQLAPSEDMWTDLTVTPPTPHDLAFRDLLRAAIKRSGIPTIDLWPAFEADMRSPDHRALYATEDPHYSLHGREIAGAQIARALLRLAPWKNVQR